MKPTEIKRYLNKKVMYKGHEYTMESAVYWKSSKGHEYSAELRRGNYGVRCRLEDVEVIP